MRSMKLSSSSDAKNGSASVRRKQWSATSSIIGKYSSSQTTSWGRSSSRGSWPRSISSMLFVSTLPLMVVCSHITIADFHGSISQFSKAAFQEGFWSTVQMHSPRFSTEATTAYICWITFQAALFLYLAGPTNTGQATPAGHLLTYKTNGFNAWIVTHLLWGVACWAGILDPAFIAKNWEGLVMVANAFGIFLAAFAYAKAHVMPTHVRDRKFSGSIFYDFWMGIELNPRIGERFDWKLFTNGRPGIIAWTLIDLSYIAYQYETYGRVELSIVLVTLLHAVYVIDFFINESWYLRTIDIAHDHFGFYLAWGSFVWLPTMYTIQAQYLGRYPASTSKFYQSLVFCVGMAGYAVFRAVNDQKDRVRRSNGKCLIWGKPARYITASYETSNGKQHKSLLLCSGWWGWSRHANYLGDLVLSTCMCALVGSSNLLVWFYAIYMTILLVHRCRRDEERCSAKYGAAWEKYCQQVRWRIVPGIW